MIALSHLACGRALTTSFRFAIIGSRSPLTLEVWSYWGNTLGVWLQRYKRSGTTPVDLAMNGYDICDSNNHFDESLQDALRDRAEYDAIRSLHLLGDKLLLPFILSTLTPDGEDIRCSSIDSISLQCIHDFIVDVSDFFACYRFPKLQCLHLSTKVRISCWEHLGLHTTALTTLSLETRNPRPPSTAQLLSILASNPHLENLTLLRYVIPDDNGDGSAIPVPLHRLKKLCLGGSFGPVFRLLNRLDHPEAMDDMTLFVDSCTAEDILGILGPYIQGHIQRDGRFQDGLGITAYSDPDFVSIEVSIINTIEGRTRGVTLATFDATLSEDLSYHAQFQLCIDFVAHTPEENVVYFGGHLVMDAVRRIVPAMPKIKYLYLICMSLADGFLQPDPNGPLANKKLLPSLRHLHLEGVILVGDSYYSTSPIKLPAARGFHSPSLGMTISVKMW
ncbi:hypothetical protein BDM02DRAFT_3118509 [Thelephora ganbajun]|uniref:Uncharacterized protein n=1 Tax=Thelephora ganbajun TaxID=370292 RepID=A0ACB6ZBI2_THEGA|nr:hypothetical protein BDM02DRAFT_3118509 [Thelephora ganbajun]